MPFSLHPLSKEDINFQDTGQREEMNGQHFILNFWHMAELMKYTSISNKTKLHNILVRMFVQIYIFIYVSIYIDIFLAKCQLQVHFFMLVALS